MGDRTALPPRNHREFATDFATERESYVMGEAKRRKMAGACPLYAGPGGRLRPVTAERMQRVMEGDGILSVMIGTEGDLTKEVLANVVANIASFQRQASWMQLHLHFDGFEAERRQPEEIPEVRQFMHGIVTAVPNLLSMSIDEWLATLCQDTALLMFRAGRHPDYHDIPTITLNHAGPVVWRTCDLITARARRRHRR